MQKLFFARVHNFIAKRVKWVHGTQRAKACADVILKWDSDLGDQVIEDVVKTLYTDIIHYKKP